MVIEVIKKLLNIFRPKTGFEKLYEHEKRIVDLRNKNKMSRTNDKFLVSENMLMWSFRYALGRRTYAVSDVVEHLKKYWNKLEPFTQYQIQEEITTAVKTECAGGECDVKSWQEILDLQPLCACMLAGGKKNLAFNRHSQYECGNDEIGVLKA